MTLCLFDLVRLTGGTLRLAAMPPRDGELTPIDRVVLCAADIALGDVFWRAAPQAGDVELAFFRGALGVVAAGPTGEPWPGRFWLGVDDLGGGLNEVAQALLAESAAGISGDSSELKVLQLCAATRPDIYPHTCERPANGRANRRCRRHAA